RALEGFLKRDRVKENLLLNGLLQMSMLDKSLFLMLPAFHALTETRLAMNEQLWSGFAGTTRELAAMTSQAFGGYAPFDPVVMVKSAIDTLTAPGAVGKSMLLGNKVIRYLRDPAEFKKWVGEDWLKDHPTFIDEVEALYGVGGRMGSREDYRKGFLEWV